jgi:hypothetical protein
VKYEPEKVNTHPPVLPSPCQLAKKSWGYSCWKINACLVEDTARKMTMSNQDLASSDSLYENHMVALCQTRMATPNVFAIYEIATDD